MKTLSLLPERSHLAVTAIEETYPATSAHGRHISIVGLGYVGLPLAVALARTAASRVVAFDIDRARIDALIEGHDWTAEVISSEIKRADLELTTDPRALSRSDFHIVAVPTPVSVTGQPDLSPLLSASRTVGSVLKRGDIVVFESTVYPGATEEECIPVLEAQSGLIAGLDFGVGYSPERVNPGDRVHRLETIVKIVSAGDPTSLDVIAQVYGSVVQAGIHLAPTIRVAEAAKVIENIQRDVNIALMNEFSLILGRLGVDTMAALDAAGTKWNFLRFTPGLVGGHCVGVDPYYLVHKAAVVGYHARLIPAGREINDGMGIHVARETIKGVLRAGGGQHSVVTVLGVTFKEDVPDIRNTRVIDIVAELRAFGFDVQVHDPHASGMDVRRTYDLALTPTEALRPAVAVVLAVPHAEYRLQGWALIEALLDSRRSDGCEAFVADVKGALSQHDKPDAVKLWRL